MFRAGWVQCVKGAVRASQACMIGTSRAGRGGSSRCDVSRIEIPRVEGGEARIDGSNGDHCRR